MQLQILIFFLIFGVVYFLEAIGGFYMATAVVSIEKQFQISSRYSGILVSGGDIGYIPAVLVVSYFGGKGDRARWIGIGCMLVAVGDIIIGSSNFLFPDQSSIDNFNETKQQLESAINAKANLKSVNSFVEYLSSTGIQTLPSELEELFIASINNSSILNYGDIFSAKCEAGNLTKEICTLYSRYINPSKVLTNEETLTMRTLSGLPYAICNTIINGLRQQFKNYKNLRHTTNYGPILTIFFGLVILGVGRTVPFSLGLPLIDDNVEKKSLPTYYAAMFFARIFGPILGLFLGSITNRYYYQFKVPYGLTSLDPLWIGRWWIGFIAMGILLLIASLALALFTCILKKFDDKMVDDGKKLKNPDENSEIIALNSSNSDKLKQSPIREKIVFHAKDPHINNGNQNKAERSALNGVKEYYKIVKQVFKSKVYAGGLIGRTIDTFVFKGFFLFLPKYLEVQFGIPQYKVNIYMGITGIFGFAFGSLTGSIVMRKLHFQGRRAAAWVLICSTITAFVPFINSTIGCSSVVSSLVNPISENSLTFNNTCNIGCECDGMPLYPVCNSRGKTFYSPCHAGCSRYDSLDVKNVDKLFYVFQNCRCSNTEDRVISRSYCSQSECSSKLHLYVVLMGVSGFVSGLSVVPAMIIVLRSVDAKNRSVALGLQGLVITVLGTLLSPIFWGSVIDKSCALWSYPYGTNERGSCTLYYSDSLRLRLHLINGSLRVLSLLTDVYVWWNAKNLILASDENTTEDIEKTDEMLALS